MKRLLLLLLAISAVSGQNGASVPAAPALTYNQLVGSGYELLQEARTGEAFLAATEAVRKDPARFEGYALAALALHTHGGDAEAKPFVEKALALAPRDQQELLRTLAAEITKGAAEAVEQDPAFRRKMDVIQLVLEDADKAKTAKERGDLLREFMTRSASLVEETPHQRIWVLRAAVALELNYPTLGWFAARRIQPDTANSNDPKIRSLMARLERKEWLGGTPISRDWGNAAATEARNGDAEAQYVMGQVAKNREEAHQWFEQAAKQGHPQAYFELGRLQGSGQGALQDDGAAAQWFRKAAAHGHAAAQVQLGIFYLRGIGVRQNSEEAIRLYHLAEQQMSAWEKNEVAWRLATDANGRFRDRDEAIVLAESACEMTGYKDGVVVDTLAAAYAEAGLWAKALATQQKAIELLVGIPSEIEGARARLRLYEQRMPYRAPRTESFL